MDIASRLNVFQEKFSRLLDEVSELKAYNGRLAEENALLRGEAAKLEDELNTLRGSSAQYLAERDDIIERVERLIAMIE